MEEIAQREYVISLLKQLACEIKNKIDESIFRKVIKPDEEVYLHWKVTKFQYTDEGVEDFAAHGEYVNKKSWHRACIKIDKSIKKSKEYSAALEIKKLGKNEIDSFIGKLMTYRLYEGRLDEADIDMFIAAFLKDLNEEPLKYGAYVELDGIVIQPESIEFVIGDIHIILRQTKIEDLEKDFRIFEIMQYRLPKPSAILNVEFLGRYANEIQMKVEQAIAILRLYKVGSVKYISYDMHSESIIDIMASGTLTAGGSDAALEKSLITAEDIHKLKKFWQTMIKALPQSFFEIGETRVDHLLIAYNRYCDALLHNGVLERRIANAVMGLESLLLKGAENQELIYRLGIRTAKIFSLLGYDPYKVREVVKDGYTIRSSFVHGSHLSYKAKRKLISKYGDTRSFLLLLLDYLRVSIILMIFMKKEKEELLDFIDDSLIDKERDSQLNSLIRTAGNIILDG